MTVADRRTPRSNWLPINLGMFTLIRGTDGRMKLRWRAERLRPLASSFNVAGGCCEACQGDGVKVEPHFLSDVYVSPDVCQPRPALAKPQTPP
jgi:excinuclease ABC subunit A